MSEKSELDEALDEEIGFTLEEAEERKRAEELKLDRFKKATMEDIENAIELLIYYNKTQEKAEKVLSKTGRKPTGQQDMIMKMFSGAKR